jgi:hypothetical protein
VVEKREEIVDGRILFLRSLVVETFLWYKICKSAYGFYTEIAISRCKNWAGKTSHRNPTQSQIRFYSQNTSPYTS